MADDQYQPAPPSAPPPEPSPQPPEVPAVPPLQYSATGQPIMPESHQAEQRAGQPPSHGWHDAAQTPPSPSPNPSPVLRPRKLLKIVAMVLAVVPVMAIGYFGGQQVFGRNGPAATPAATNSSFPQPDQSPGGGSSAKGKTSTVNCTSETGPDATTTSQKFVDVDGTNCTYRSGPNPETLVLSGKLTGRNTDGTGMSVTINVNDKDCTGGETLNYNKNWTPMFSACTFNVPANSAVKIRWRFLSPFSGTAAVLRSSANIAPYINGVAVSR